MIKNSRAGEFLGKVLWRQGDHRSTQKPFTKRRGTMDREYAPTIIRPEKAEKSGIGNSAPVNRFAFWGIPSWTDTIMKLFADSYLGASFYHFHQILEKTPDHLLFKLVVLSVGINNKDQDPEESSTKQLRMLYKKARAVFSSLPWEQWWNLTVMNNFLTDRFLVLNLLPADQFQTVGDNIHWIQDTGERTLLHWCEQLWLNV